MGLIHLQPVLHNVCIMQNHNMSPLNSYNCSAFPNNMLFTSGLSNSVKLCLEIRLFVRMREAWLIITHTRSYLGRRADWLHLYDYYFKRSTKVCMSELFMLLLSFRVRVTG